MKRFPAIARFLVTTLSLSLSASPLCEVARGDDRSPYQPIRFTAVAFAPIGRVFPVGGLHINGHVLYGEQTIWAGDMLEASEEATRVVLDSIGEIVLERLAKLRLTRSVESTNSPDGGQALIVSLFSGKLRARLKPNAGMYIEAGGSVFAAANGASFCIDVREGPPVVELASGEVRTVAAEFQPEVFGRIVNVDSVGRPTGFASKTMKVPPNLFRTISILMRYQGTGIKLDSGRLVRFLLLNPAAGNFKSPEVTVPINDYGVATATFTAGPVRDETKVTATVVGYALPSWEGAIKVGKPSPLKKYLLGGAAAAAIIIIIKWPRDKPLRQEPPPVIP